MNYKNGRDVLPPELLKELQKYIQGDLIYIPKKEEARSGWGTNNGTRMLIQKRNQEIFERFSDGLSVLELTRSYHLSEDSIRKIISKQRSHLYLVK